jgi:hypothetical protein
MSSIAAGTTTGSALVSTGDTTGELVLKTNGTTTAVTIDTSQNVTIEGSLTVDGGSANISGTSSAGANIKLYEDTDNGTNYVALKAPDTIAADVTWTLPDADGTTGQVLSTNGSGVLSWASGGDSSGDVIGPASATDNAVARFDSTTGKLIQNSGVSIDDSNNVTGIANLSFNSGYGSSAVAYGVRAWVNFNGTGTVAIRASGNVSSITDGGTGNYTINFTTAMPDANYCAVGSSKFVSGAAGQNLRFGVSAYGTDFTTTAVNVQTTTAGNQSLADSEMVSVSIFR